VTVTGVRTLVVRGKEKRVGRFSGQRPSWKKAFVTLKPGDNIEFFEGV
jgi:large subunit ribosomal protein L23